MQKFDQAVATIGTEGSVRLKSAVVHVDDAVHIVQWVQPRKCIWVYWVAKHEPAAAVSRSQHHYSLIAVAQIRHAGQSDSRSDARSCH
jgi:hypothetical protein